MLKYDDNGNVYSTTWEDERLICYHFPIICNYPGIDMGRVYPIKQKDVAKICSVIKNDNRIDIVILFGSAANIRCTQNSDLDIAIKLKENNVNDEVKNQVSEKIQIACDWNADIIWRDRITKKDSIYNDIILGVRLK